MGPQAMRMHPHFDMMRSKENGLISSLDYRAEIDIIGWISADN